MRRKGFGLGLATFLALGPLVASAADVAPVYGVPGNTLAPPLPGYVRLCPSSDGSKTAIPCKTGPYTIVAPTNSVVTTGGTAIQFLPPGGALSGGNLETANAAGVCVSQNGTAATTAGVIAGVVTECVGANAPFYLTANLNAVSVNSTASGAVIAGKGLQ